mmetsp:Transcript_79393/g.125268  ORF Transcript_79393/g.125268 Transcript_79393/m.125268 type:complete len:354 (+) Transcript_79393:1215-2276(+)
MDANVGVERWLLRFFKELHFEPRHQSTSPRPRGRAMSEGAAELRAQRVQDRVLQSHHLNTRSASLSLPLGILVFFDPRHIDLHRRCLRVQSLPLHRLRQSQSEGETHRAATDDGPFQLLRHQAIQWPQAVSLLHEPTAFLHLLSFASAAKREGVVRFDLQSQVQVLQSSHAIVEHSLGITTAAQRHDVSRLQFQRQVQVVDGTCEVSLFAFHFSAARQVQGVVGIQFQGQIQIHQGPLAVVQHALGIAPAAQRHRVLRLQLQGSIQVLDRALEIPGETLQFTAAPEGSGVRRLQLHRSVQILHGAHVVLQHQLCITAAAQGRGVDGLQLQCQIQISQSSRGIAPLAFRFPAAP